MIRRKHFTICGIVFAACALAGCSQIRITGSVKEETETSRQANSGDGGQNTGAAGDKTEAGSAGSSQDTDAAGDLTEAGSAGSSQDMDAAGDLTEAESAGSTLDPVSVSDVKITDTGFCLDTIVSITLYGTEDETILDDTFALIREYENLLSRTIEGSDIWKINHSAGEPVEVSEDTAELIEKALSYSELSGGAFDISVAPVILLWNFQENTGTLPDPVELGEALTHVNYENILLEGTTVTLADPEGAVDLGGIAKGYIADCVKEYLKSRGIASGLINLGGNVLTIGVKPDGSQWNIGIRKPFAESTDLITTVKCEDLSVVTSGTYERYFEVDGRIYHHILDTETGYPVENGLTSVTILSEKSVDGDALSTTCFVLGLEDGLELAESLDGIEAMFITDDLDLVYTSGFPQ